MANNDPGDVDLTVNGRLIREFVGVKGWKPSGAASRNEGPGGQAHGFNLQRNANGVNFTIMVKDTSPDLDYLYSLSEGQSEVAIVASIERNLETYPVGHVMAVGCERGVLNPGEMQRGAEAQAETVSFEVVGIGRIRRRKEAA